MTAQPERHHRNRIQCPCRRKHRPRASPGREHTCAEMQSRYAQVRIPSRWASFPCATADAITVHTDLCHPARCNDDL
jgi:hypothetical protein